MSVRAAPLRFGRGWDALALVRPTLMIPLWTMHVLGALHATGRWGFLPTRTWFLLSVAHSGLLGAVYVLNQLADLKTDAANAKLFLLAGGYLSRRFAVGEMVGLALSSGVMVGVGMWRGGVRPAAAVLFGASGVLGVLYSVPPVRWKSRAGWDLLANAVGYGMVAFAVGWVAFEPLSMRTWRLAAPYACSVAGAFAFTTIPDIPGDRLVGDRTLGVGLGVRATGWVGLGCLLVGCLVGWLVRNYLSLVALVPSVLVYRWAMERLSREGDVRSLLRVTQSVILWLSLLGVVGVPIYGLWLGAVVMWVRWYYRRRWGMRYP